MQDMYKGDTGDSLKIQELSGVHELDAGLSWGMSNPLHSSEARMSKSVADVNLGKGVPQEGEGE